MDLSLSAHPQLWEGAVSWTSDGQWWEPWRLHPEDELLAYAPPLFERARLATGVRLRLRTDAGALRVELDFAPDAQGCADLVVDGMLTQRIPVQPGISEVQIALSGGLADVEFWLPHTGRVRVGRVTAERATIAVPMQNARPRWVAYGSSITQCSESDGPAETWPALVARELGLDLTCLGFGAECHLDPIIPATIAGRQPDLISLCLGINVYGQSSFGPRAWRGQVAGFVRSVRVANPDADIVLISPIVSPTRESAQNKVGMTLAEIRCDVETVTGHLRAADSRLFGIHGLDLLGLDEGDMLIDGVHPGQDGYRRMAARIAPVLAGILGQS
ncbi:hypothetical protein GCM10022381_26850 [Leifsonia kafniensis]|uniref:SGNH hydrolase-type esterase domain-containing protein n=1 Tax=Leifsonia kafniensis TaxID=475957 RepID=A0ABP7KRI1_9MICO